MKLSRGCVSSTEFKGLKSARTNGGFNSGKVDSLIGCPQDYNRSALGTGELKARRIFTPYLPKGSWLSSSSLCRGVAHLRYNMACYNHNRETQSEPGCGGGRGSAAQPPGPNRPHPAVPADVGDSFHQGIGENAGDRRQAYLIDSPICSKPPRQASVEPTAT